MKTPVAPSIHTEIPRAEYPRPDFERKDWLNLNGQWSFRLDTQGSDDVQQQAGTGADGYAGAWRVETPAFYFRDYGALLLG